MIASCRLSGLGRCVTAGSRTGSCTCSIGSNCEVGCSGTKSLIGERKASLIMLASSDFSCDPRCCSNLVLLFSDSDAGVMPLSF